MSYYEKKAAKIERYERLAEKNKKVANDNSFDKVCGEKNTGIPFGQPILVGHHSEKRHRAHLEKIDNKIRKGIEASDKAEYYENKIASIENNNSIQSDDPEAVIKLKEKLDKLKKAQERMKLINSIIRKKKLSNEEKLELAISKGVKKELFEKALEPDFCGRVGFATYSLQNNNQNIRSCEQRLKTLQSINDNPLEGKEFENGISTIIEDGYIRVYFSGKPNDEVRSAIKSYPYSLKFSRYNDNAWQRKITANTNRRFYSRLCEYLEKLENFL